jgi:membrane protein DedA with SNARE-associated domain
MPLRSLMHDLFPLIAEYGVFAVFASVFLTQAGAPLPAVPTLLVAGALSATGTLHWMELLPAALTGALLGDAIWYLAGQRYGRHVMALLCRLSLSPDSCVRRTRSQFERWGAPMLLIAKFDGVVGAAGHHAHAVRHLRLVRPARLGAVGGRLDAARPLRTQQHRPGAHAA